MFVSKNPDLKAATRGVQQKNFLEISQNSQENTCEFCEISKNTFSTEHLWATVSADSKCIKQNDTADHGK